MLYILNSMLNAEHKPILLRMLDHSPYTFNDLEVGDRKGQNMADALTEYNDSQALTMRLIEQIPLTTRRQNGVLSWYGDAYDLEDFLVYTYYGHKREHTAQIAVFRDSLKTQNA